MQFNTWIWNLCVGAVEKYDKSVFMDFHQKEINAIITII